MPARIPLQSKTPFAIDSRPLTEVSSAHAGLLAISRAFRSLKLPDLIAANLQLKSRKRGFTESQFIESILLLQTVGGDCPEDFSLLHHDSCLEKGLGYALPKTRTVRDFLDFFHEEDLAALRPKREEQKSFILAPSSGIEALQRVQEGLVQRVAKLYGQQNSVLSIATIDMDATIIESHKESALSHYEGGRGYQPMVAVWSEADLVVADQFRDGNVPAKQEPLSCAKTAFGALPNTVKQRYFRGDSACHENGLIQWLRDPERSAESGGRIGFAISAVMSGALAGSVAMIPEKQWKTITVEADGTLRQWAEVDFVPGDKTEKKDSLPLRYIGVRLLKAQGSLFADGSDRHHHAVVTNLDWEGRRLLQWQREKAGTIEHVHDEVKNALGGGHMPSQHFNVNAAWFKLALMAYNLASAIRGLCFAPAERTVRFKKFRLMLVHICGRMSRFGCKLRLRFCASQSVIDRFRKVWDIFQLPTQATAFK